METRNNINKNYTDVEQETNANLMYFINETIAEIEKLRQKTTSHIELDYLQKLQQMLKLEGFESCIDLIQSQSSYFDYISTITPANNSKFTAISRLLKNIEESVSYYAAFTLKFLRDAESTSATYTGTTTTNLLRKFDSSLEEQKAIFESLRPQKRKQMEDDLVDHFENLAIATDNVEPKKVERKIIHPRRRGLPATTRHDDNNLLEGLRTLSLVSNSQSDQGKQEEKGDDPSSKMKRVRTT